MRYMSALQGCDFPVGAARSTLHILRLLCLSRSCRGPGGNRTRDRALRNHARKLRDNFHTRGEKKERRHSESASTRTTSAEARTIPAEGSSAHRKNAKHLDHAEGREGRSEIKKLEFLYLDHTDPRRGSRGQIRTRVLYLDHADPRVARAPQESQKTSSFCTSTTPILAEGRNPDRRSKSCPGALAT